MEKRIDVLLVEKYGVSSREKAQNLIENGLVFCGGKKITKSSIKVEENALIKIEKHDEYVSRGAYKLLGAIEQFNLNFKDKTVLDIGASTGGFTQVALQNGAKKVYALDVGSNQLDKTLVSDKRVVNMQNTDIRNLEEKNIQDCDIFIGDLSFISLQKVLPSLLDKFGKKEMMFLFKPQFECGKELAKKYKGVIKDKKVHKELIYDFEKFAESINLVIYNIAKSPIKGGDGNIEYLIYFNCQKGTYDIDQIVENAFK